MNADSYSPQAPTNGLARRPGALNFGSPGNVQTGGNMNGPGGTNTYGINPGAGVDPESNNGQTGYVGPSTSPGGSNVPDMGANPLSRAPGTFNAGGMGAGGSLSSPSPSSISASPSAGPNNSFLGAYAKSGNDPNAQLPPSLTGAAPAGGPGQGFEHWGENQTPVQSAPLTTGFHGTGPQNTGPQFTTNSTPGATGVPNPAPGNPTSNPTGQPSNGFGTIANRIDTSNVPGLAGGDALGGAMKDAQQAAYKNATGYLDPQWTNDQKALETKLTNQGVPQNSEAWNKAMDDFGRQKQFAYQQAQSNAVTQGNTAQNQLFTQGLASNQNQFGQNSQQAQFYNQAQQQLASQGMNQQQISEVLRAHLVQEGLSQQQIDNIEQQNRFQNSMTMRNQGLNEQLLQQRNPLDMLNLLGGQSVGQPQFTNTPGSSMNPADLMAAFNQQYQGQLTGYNAQVGQQNSNTSAMASIIAAMLCDRRFKTNIRMIGMHVVGVPLYEFDYLWGEHAVGVMADELEQVRPEAVFTLANGTKIVDFARI